LYQLGVISVSNKRSTVLNLRPYTLLEEITRLFCIWFFQGLTSFCIIMAYNVSLAIVYYDAVIPST
jgi:hypothetical protein